MSREFYTSVKQNIEFLISKGERTIIQLNFDELHWIPNEESNSMAILVKHLHGNMLSRWTDFLTTDGEKPTRERDAEFEGGFISRDELIQSWKSGWDHFIKTIESLQDEDFNRTVYLRGEAFTVMQLIQDELVHYAMHIGQMIYIGKLVKNNEWQTISIPKGQSKEYNENKFKQSNQ